ncbi:MAG TPA: glucose-6-phosphate dehydrogenase [Solirubrobacterales bacterium]
MAHDPADAPPLALRPIDPHVIVLFGVSGDLARRKLLPGLYHLYATGLLPEFRILGCMRGESTDDELRALAREAADNCGDDTPTDEKWDPFAERLASVDITLGPETLAAAVDEERSRLGDEARILHYLSVPPKAVDSLLTLIAEAGLNTRRARIVLEKPFGHDLASARALNARLHEVFAEEQVFRIDHYLGKEAAQNILALRFANGLFEPIWNLNHIEHVQIDVPETLAVGDRAAFYESTGAFRDMIVTHLFQILAFVAMEPPTALEPDAITIEKNKVFRSLQPLDPGKAVRGQYEGYHFTEGVDPDSSTETFVALACTVDNWRWAGVPFFLRTGKRMAESWRIISIAFREPPKSMFPSGSGVGSHGPDHLTFDLDESSRLSLSFYGKRPGPGFVLDKQSLQFSLTEVDHDDTLEAYERLIRDAMIGDHTLFTTADGIEHLWAISEPLLEAETPVHLYRQGSWGPEAMNQLVEPFGWRLPFARHWRGPLDGDPKPNPAARGGSDPGGAPRPG